MHKIMCDLKGFLSNGSPFSIVVTPFSFLYDDGKFYKADVYTFLRQSRSAFQRKRRAGEYIFSQEKDGVTFYFIDDVVMDDELTSLFDTFEGELVAFCNYYGRSYGFRKMYADIAGRYIVGSYHNKFVFYPVKQDQLESRNSVHHPLA